MSAIGYLVPQFPGQTHNFFWREVLALRALGTAAHLISTRPPPPALRSPSWAEGAGAATSYLFPLKVSDLEGIAGVLARHGARCIPKIFGATQRLHLLALLPLAAKLVHLARRQGWRHLHVHSCGDAANIALLAKWLAGLDYSITLHNTLGASGGNQRLKWRNAAFAVVITQTLLGEVRGALGADLPARVAVAPMGVDAGFFARARPYQPWRGEGELRIFSCGRLNPGKGQRFLLEALARLRGRGLPATLALAGEDDEGGGGYRAELEAAVRRLGLRAYVRLLGAVAEEAVREELERCHVFALPSLQEALGVALMEAMAMEVPVVATRVGGVAELVAHGADGVLVPPGDVAALAEAIAAIAADPARARSLGAGSRAKIVERFGADGSARVIRTLVGKAT